MVHIGDMSHMSHMSCLKRIGTYLCISALHRFILMLYHVKKPAARLGFGVFGDITMNVIASVEKYENAGMKFRTVPAFALAESRASDACCLFLTVHTLTRSQRVFLPRSALELHTWRTHSLDPPPRAATRAVPVRFLPAAAHAALL